MSENIILKQNPKIEFQFTDRGFQVIDEQKERNSGFYSYEELESIELNKIWFPKLAKRMRFFTLLLNGAPYFPEADTYKKANMIFHHGKKKSGIWLTDSKMADTAKRIKEILDVKIKHNSLLK